MKFRNIGVIISREYVTRVRKKSFLVITFVVPMLFALSCGLLVLIMFLGRDKTQTVQVLDESGIVLPYLTDNKLAVYEDCSAYDMDYLKSNLSESGADVVLYISQMNAETMNVSVEAYSLKPMTVDLKDAIENKIENAVEDYRLASYDIPELKQIIQDIKADVRIATYTVKESGEEKITSSEVYMVLSMALTMIIYVFIAMFSGMVMSGVIEEKSSKVMEVLVSSVKSTELMFGKIIGVACVALSQFLLWAILIGIILASFSAFGGFDSLTGNPEQMEQISSITGGMGMDSSVMDALMADDATGISAVYQTLAGINYGQLLGAFIAYFLLGYLLYASLFAAIGSAVDNESDTSQLQLPITIPLLIAFFIAFSAYRAPDSQLAFWASLFPLTSPIVMLARIPFGVATWELLLSLGLLLLTFLGMAYISAKIYKVGLLVSGKKTTFADLWKWLKQS